MPPRTEIRPTLLPSVQHASAVICSNSSFKKRAAWVSEFFEKHALVMNRGMRSPPLGHPVGSLALVVRLEYTTAGMAPTPRPMRRLRMSQRWLEAACGNCAWPPVVLCHHMSERWS